MASNKKTKKPEGNEPEIDEGVIEGQEQPTDEAPEGDEAEAGDDVPDEANDEPEEAAEPPSVHEVKVKLDASEAVAVLRHHIAGLGNLHARIEKSVRTIGTTGGQEKVFALHQIELLTGRLKMVLPDAIPAADADLRDGLEALLSLL